MRLSCILIPPRINASVLHNLLKNEMLSEGEKIAQCKRIINDSPLN
jgi:hypothetical protein